MPPVGLFLCWNVHAVLTGTQKHYFETATIFRAEPHNDWCPLPRLEKVSDVDLSSAPGLDEELVFNCCCFYFALNLTTRWCWNVLVIIAGDADEVDEFNINDLTNKLSLLVLTFQVWRAQWQLLEDSKTQSFQRETCLEQSCLYSGLER